MNHDPVKERIISIAHERFMGEGFAHVSVDQLAADLGMSKKTFYKHFQSKEDLVTEIVFRMMTEIRSSVIAIVESDGDFIEKLNSLMTLVGMVVSRIGRVYQNDLRRYTPELWNTIEEFRRKNIVENLTLLLRQGCAEGHVRKDLNHRVVLLAYVGAVDALIRPDVLIEESFSSLEALQGILHIFFHGILTEGASRQLRTLQDVPSHSSPKV